MNISLWLEVKASINNWK